MLHRLADAEEDSETLEMGVERASKRARDGGGAGGGGNAEDTSDYGFFCRLLRQAGCEVQAGANAGGGDGGENGANASALAFAPVFARVGASTVSVRQVIPGPGPYLLFSLLPPAVPACRTLTASAAAVSGQGVTFQRTIARQIYRRHGGAPRRPRPS